MSSRLKKALKMVSDMLVISVVVLAILLNGVQLFGIKPYSVLSGSMQSVYPTGSLIYVIGVDPARLEVSDVITFKMTGGTVATHRIVELVPDENHPDTVRFRTKGDENEIADGSLVDFSSVIGKPVFCIPLIGYLVTYMMCPPGKYIAIIVAVALVLIETMIGMFFNDKDVKRSMTK